MAEWTTTMDGAQYLPLPERGENAYLVQLPDGSERVLFAHPERGPEHAIGELIDPPPTPAPRRTVLKSTILARITDEQLEAALALMSPRQLERWRIPDKPSVYADDPEMVAMLKAIGANPDEVMAA